MNRCPAFIAFALAVALPARAQETSEPKQDAPKPEESKPAASQPEDAKPPEEEKPQEPDPRPLEEQVDELRDQLAAMEERLRAQEQVPINEVVVTVGGYVDFGFFVPQGDGVGFVQDYGNMLLPEYSGKYAWVFLGDILAPTVNSRGEAADLGMPPGVNRFDSVGSNGAPGFLLNEANLTVRVGLHQSAIVTTSLNFVPRTGNEFALGDFFDLDLAQLEWVAIGGDPNLSVFAGKIDPVFGIEYKQRRADQRFGITPSLAQRYTSGSQLGLKARAKLFSDWLILAAAVTNGSSTTEQFHFHDEVDSNSGKTATGRIAVDVKLEELAEALGGELELGVSGEIGSQDRARDNEGIMWFAGADFEYRSAGFALRGEFLTGRAPGDGAQGVYGLELDKAGYVELNWLIIPEIGLLARGDLREARVSLGNERLYVTKSWRVTGGGKFVFGQHVALKLEYLHNGEYGAIPQIRNDVFTTSLLISY